MGRFVEEHPHLQTWSFKRWSTYEAEADPLDFANRHLARLLEKCKFVHIGDISGEDDAAINVEGFETTFPNTSCIASNMAYYWPEATINPTV